ncbi:hypothetical protein ACTXT7_016300 [Hymenolepis weldensis]
MKSFPEPLTTDWSLESLPWLTLNTLLLSWSVWLVFEAIVTVIIEVVVIVIEFIAADAALEYAVLVVRVVVLFVVEVVSNYDIELAVVFVVGVVVITPAVDADFAGDVVVTVKCAFGRTVAVFVQVTGVVALKVRSNID